VAGKQRYELWAESVRDIGILLLVFAPLDTVIREKNSQWDWLLAGAIGVLGIALIWVGVDLEADP
jgi:hypothetical protein